MSHLDPYTPQFGVSYHGTMDWFVMWLLVGEGVGAHHIYKKGIGWRSRDRSLYSGGLTMGEKKEVCGCDLQFFVGMVG